MNNIIPHSRPYIGKAEAKAAYKVIMSRHLAMGEKVAELEQVWAKTFYAEDAAMVGSGLAALRLSLLALNVGPGDEVIIPAYSCVALHNAVLSVGAVPVLADVDPVTWLLTQGEVEKRLTTRTKAIIAVGLFGFSFLPDVFRYDIPVIEDYSHGPKSECGLAITSFYPTKYYAATRGGMVYGNKYLVGKARSYRSYRDRSPSANNHNDEPTDLDAVMVLEQLKRKEKIIDRREKLWAGYNYLLKELPVKRPHNATWFPYRYVIRIEQNASEISAWMKTHDVYAEQPVWDYRHTVSWPGDLPMTDDAFRRCLSLPIYPDMTIKEQNRVVEVLKKCLT